MRHARRSGLAMLEVVLATAIGLVLVTALAARIEAQARLLHAARDEARARAALLEAHERLRAGLVAAPAAGEKKPLDGPEGYQVTVERAPGALDARLAAKGELVAVVIRVRWKTEKGPGERTLATLVAGGGP